MNRTRSTGPEKLRLLGNTRIYLADIVPAHCSRARAVLKMVFKLIFRHRMIVSLFLKFSCLECTSGYIETTHFLHIPSSKRGLFCV